MEGKDPKTTYFKQQTGGPCSRRQVCTGTGAAPSEELSHPELPCALPALQQPASLLRALFIQKKHGNTERESANSGHLPLPGQAAGRLAAQRRARVPEQHAATSGRGHPPCARPPPPNPSKCPWAVWRAGGHEGSWRAGSTQPSLGSRACKKCVFVLWET